MKRCLTCGSTYADESLSFCVTDGALLVSVPAHAQPTVAANFSSPQTSPPPTEILPANAQVYTPPSPPAAWQPASPSAWRGAQALPRRSNPLPWIIGGASLLLLVGLGIGIFLYLRGNGSQPATANANNANANQGVSTTPGGKPAIDGRLLALQDDFSAKKWPTSDDELGKTFYQDGEYRVRSAEKKYISVRPLGGDEYSSENATARVTLRNVAKPSSTSLGNGLVMHSNKKQAGANDYSFVIYTGGDDASYRVIRHRGGIETSVVKWTKSSLIKRDTEPNQLEVRATGDQLAFYINGEFATSITDTEKYRTGLVGLYTSYADEIAFDNLEIYRGPSTATSTPTGTPAKPVDPDTASTDSEEVLRQLTDLENEWNNANLRGDRAAIMRILADEFRGVGANNAVEDKKQYLANLAPNTTIKSLALSDLKVSLSGNNAVLTGLNTARFKAGQKWTFRFTDTFIWRDGRWQAISSQATRVK